VWRRSGFTSAQLLPGLRAAVASAGLTRDPLFLVTAAEHWADGDQVVDYDSAVASNPRDPNLVETMGGRLLFSSGTSGRPKPFRLPPQDTHPADVEVRLGPLLEQLEFHSGDVVYLSTGPAYHAAPFGFLQTVHQLGGTVVLMERFDAEAALAAIERYRVTHSQWVPTMFVRLLRLPEPVRMRYDLSSHKIAVHSGAPCPLDVKRGMLAWWGPIIHEYYGASEGYGRTAIGPHEWCTHPGSVGRPVGGSMVIADDAGRALPSGAVGTVWFQQDGAPEPVRSADGSANLSELPGWGTAKDLGYLDEEGYLYLAGRSGETIISGGVNIYPAEVENVLTPHPAVEDVAVLGVPDEEFGEQVKAVIQPAPGTPPGAELERELIAYCRGRLAHFKCPRSVDFVARLPRSEAGKLLSTELRSRYKPEQVGASG
jgi:fatty-acyl-CoA synthase